MNRYIDSAKKDSKAEFECTLLAGRIQTKDLADRINETLKTLSIGPPKETSLLRVMYEDDIRVEIETAHNIQRVCSTNSFKGVPLVVQKKYGNDNIDAPNLSARFKLRVEEKIRNDWDASPNTAKAIRLMNRRSYTSHDELFSIDFSMVKSRKEKKETLRDILKNDVKYELEIEFVNKKTQINTKLIEESLLKIINTILKSYQQSEFLLTQSEQEKYATEFSSARIRFVNPVTIERRHLREDVPHNILKDYTVTVKADGERFMLYVARDKRLLRIDKNYQVRWTGLKALTDEYLGDYADGEYIHQKNLYCIFDMYRYKTKDIQSLPLMTTDEDVTKNPEKSRLGCSKLFVEDLKTKFTTEPTLSPLRIETKLFLAGDGSVMEEAINRLLDAEYEYETDGLIFTPRSSPVPKVSRWNEAYKWKPPTQNSIDFFLKLSNTVLYDPATDRQVKKGELYISRTPGEMIFNPCETLTEEYVPKQLPADLEGRITEKRMPALFSPNIPEDQDAYKIYVPIDEKGLAHDELNIRVEDNTIVECVYDVEKSRWNIMRTRYDKTFKFKVQREPEFGNDIAVANNIWTSIHIPIPPEMIRKCTTTPITDELEDEIYYKTDIIRQARILNESYNFHRAVKSELYHSILKEGDTLLEFGVGKAGDLNLWKRNRLSKVVGIDPAISGLRQGCKYYLEDRALRPTDYRPLILLVKGDMLEPLYQQESDKFAILSGEDKATTKYLENFEGLKKFDSSSSQFNIHYACGTEEIFRSFVKNVDIHTKDTFFGTCLDGQAVYSLLVGKKTHIFTNGKDVGGQFTKEYDDKEIWSDEFGMKIKVSLESFDKPVDEYLVPFGKITEILKEFGFDLKETHLFSELYSRQTKKLTPEQQAYSFINRTFVFKRGKKGGDPVPVVLPVEGKQKVKLVTEKEEEPILFNGPGEDQGEHKAFSNMAEYPIQIESITYPTVEHYFQWQKAHEFDKEMEEKILKTPSAKAVKALGKKVKNFVKELWDDKRDELMARGVKAKFVQHPELQKRLMETADKKIGFANARDTYWSIGTSVDTEKSKTPSKWKGQNKLGKILMMLREEFKGS